LSRAELREGLNELNPHVKHLIITKIIKWLEEQSGDRSSLLKLVFNSRWCEYFGGWEDASHLSIYFTNMDGFVEVLDGFFEQRMT
jgi:hypothetical protein